MTRNFAGDMIDELTELTVTSGNTPDLLAIIGLKKSDRFSV